MEEDRLAKYHSVDAQPAPPGPVNPGAEHSTRATLSATLPSTSPIAFDGQQSDDNYSQPFRKNSKGTNRLVVPVATFLKHVKGLAFAERINILLIFVPIGIAVGFAHIDPGVDFVLNALAVIPLAVVISTATESIANRLGDTLGALLNVTFGNAAELIIFLIALSKDQISIVQASLLGSLLTNLLLVLGTAFLVGGLRFKKDLYDRPAGRLSVGLFDLGLLIAIFPVAFLAATNGTKGVLGLSRGISIGLILVYIGYLYIQMSSRANVGVSNQQPSTMEPMPMSELQPTRFSRAHGPFTTGSKKTHGMRTKHDHTRWRSWISLLSSQIGRKRTDSHSKPTPDSNPLLHPDSSVEDEDDDSFRHSIETDLESQTRNADSETARTEQSLESQSRRYQQQMLTQGFVSRDFVSRANPKQSRPSADTPMASYEGTDDEESEDQQTNSHTGSSPLPPSPPSTPPSSAQDPMSPRRVDRTSHVPPIPLRALADSDDVGWTEQIHERPSTQFVRRDTIAEFKEYRQSRQSAPLYIAVIVLCIATGVVSICLEFAVDAIPAIIESWHVSHILLGFIILPVVGNAAEYVTAVKMASQNRMVLAKSVAIESSAQIVLFTTPAMVLIGWARSRQMSLHFDIYEIATVVMTALVASVVVSYGRSDWKQGSLLVGIYSIVAMGAVFYPTQRWTH